jgi:uncharacterized protein YjbI with pentapeptide repeats
MPGLPDDIDWRLYNEAPADQWFDGPLRGDEDFELINMHPQHARRRGRLPGVWQRAFLERRKDPTRRDSALLFEEVSLSLDTVWLLPDADLGVVVHRGSAVIATDDGGDIVHVMTGHENLTDPPRSQAHYREEMRKRADPDEGFRYMLDTRALLPLGCVCAIQELTSNSDMQMENLGQQNAQNYATQQTAQAQQQVEERLDQVEQELQPHQQQLSEHSVDVSSKLDQARGATQGQHEPSEREQELNRIIEKIAPGANSGQVDITQVDFDGFDELEAFNNQIAQEERERAEATVRERIDELKRQNDPPREELTKAIQQMEEALARMREPPPLPRPDLDVDLDQARRQLDELDQYQDWLREAGVDEEQIKAALPDMDSIREQLEQAERQIGEQYRDGAHFMDECRSPHPGEEGERRARLLEAAAAGTGAARGDYAFVDLHGCTLRNLDLSDAYLEYVDFTDARLVDVDLTGAILAKATLRRTRFERVSATNANLGATEIEDALFVDCDLTQARFGRASLRRHRFERCTLVDRQEMFLEAILERVAYVDCDMYQCNFLERDLQACAFTGSNLTQSNFVQCDLTATDFTRANVTSTNFVSSRAPRACFDSAVMDNARFIDEPILNDASLRDARATGANFQDADLAGGDLTHARLDRADLSGAWLSDARLDRISAIDTQFRKAELARARLHKADLRQASLMKARLQRADLAGANLYSVSFLFSTLGETRFSGANLNNTILRDWQPRGG